MNKANFFEKVLRGASKCLPEIMTASGILFQYGAIIDAVRHTPTAEKLIKEEETKLGRPLSKTEIVKTCWKCYIPTAIESTVGTICIVSGAVKYRKQNAAVMALCSMSEGALTEYKKKLAEAVGTEKAKEIESEIIEDRVKLMDKSEFVPESSTKKLMIKPDAIPCYDEYSGRIFYSTRNDIERAQNEANRSAINEGQVSLNDFYYYLGLEPIGIGENFGWTTSKGLIDISFGSHLLGDIAYLSMSFNTRPYDIWPEYY